MRLAVLGAAVTCGAEGSIARMEQFAAELARRNLDVIVSAGPQPMRALLATGTKTPIVFASRRPNQ